MNFEWIARTASKISPKFVDHSLKSLAMSGGIDNILDKLQSFQLRKVNTPKKILVIPGINIGDAVIVQSFITFLKNSFPNMDISYVYQHKAFPLIRSNPHINRHFPYFTSIGFPSKKDIRVLKKVVLKDDYDVIFNLCPFFTSSVFKKSDSAVLYPLKLIFDIIRAYDSKNQKAHFAHRVKCFSKEVVEKLSNHDQSAPSNQKEIPVPHLFTNSKSHSKTKALMKNLMIPPESPKVMFNPDSSSRLTLIPIKLQAEILRGILALDKLECVLMNCGFTFEGMEEKILKEIPGSQRKKIVLIPKNIEIDVYSALIDSADVFISGDTGPLHIGAAKKILLDSDNFFRNSTAIVGIFGATSAKIYGYDSYSAGYMSSAQQAPSKVFESAPSCKNLTCIDKSFKHCQEIKCFEGVQSEQIISYVHRLLS